MPIAFIRKRFHISKKYVLKSRRIENKPVIADLHVSVFLKIYLVHKLKKDFISVRENFFHIVNYISDKVKHRRSRIC